MTADKADRQVVCILGMHRSGTSPVARMLNLLGVDLGPQARLLEPRPDNPKGFWEHRLIVEINDEILGRLGGSWDHPPAFPAGWEGAPGLDYLRDRARALIQEDFGHSELWGWKDPRTCLTLPFWRRLVGPMRYVLCFRNPRDVARSLARRLYGAQARGESLWIAYGRSALEHTAGQPRLLVFYDDLIGEGPRELRRLAEFVGEPSRANDTHVQARVGEFVDSELQHHRTSLIELADDPMVPFPAKALYMTLRAWRCREQGQPEAAEVDQHFEEALNVLARQGAEAHVDSLGKQERIRELTAERESLEQTLRAIYASRAWKAITMYGRIRQRLLPKRASR